MSYALNSDPAEASIQAQDMAKAYDACARDYDEKYKATLGWDPAEYFTPLIAKYVEDRKASVYDCGCGTGALVEGLRKAGFDGRIEGYDVSPEMVKLCEARKIFDKVYVHDMYENFPVKAEEFDVVMTTAALLFVDKKNLMDEYVRCVKPGGYLLVASRQDRMKSFGYAEHLASMVENGTLNELYHDVKPLCGGREEYRKDEFLYMTFVFRKANKN